MTDPLNSNNPVTVQVLGICSALAVTTGMTNALVMAVAVTLVTAFSNLFVSMLRSYIPKSVRMIVQLVIIADLVTVVELLLKAYAFDSYKQLSVFIGLIITNCIIMGRLEAYAMANDPYRSFLDGIGNAAGYGLILVIIGFFRELLGSGTLLGFKVLGDPIAKTGLYALGYENNGFMLLSPMALIVVGIIIWVQRSRNPALVEEN